MHRSRRRRRGSLFHRLLWVEPFWLLLIAPSLLFTEYIWDPRVRPLLIVALFLFWPLRLKAGHSLLPKGIIGWFVGFLILWLPVTIWRAADSPQAWELAGYTYLALTIFVSLTHWPPLRREPLWLTLPVVILGTGLALIGPELLSVNPDKMLDFYQTEEFAPTTMDSQGETINPNVLAGALAFIFPLSLALALRWPQTRWGWSSLLLWGPILIMGNGLILSQSRSGWLAVGIAILLLGWLRLFGPKRKNSTSFWQWALLVILMSGLLVVIVVLWRVGIVDTLFSDRIASGAQNSLTRRLGIWRLSLEMVISNPITGVGLGIYEQVFRNNFPTVPLTGGRGVPPHAHNLFIQLLLDLGLLGFIAYIGVLVELARQLLQKLSKSRNSMTHVLRCGLLSSLFAMLIVGSFDHALWGTKLIFIPWALFALAFILGDSNKQHDPEA